jgi:hypothetical protein
MVSPRFERAGEMITVILGCKHNGRLQLVCQMRRHLPEAFKDSKHQHIHREQKAQMFCPTS